MKKVIFINPPQSPLEEDLYIPVHYLSLGAVAEQQGWEAKIYDFDFFFKHHGVEPDLRDILNFLWEWRTEERVIFGLTAYGHNLWVALEMAKAIKRYSPHSLVVLGGPEATFSHEAILRSSSDIDIVVRGEGEETFREILLAHEQGKDFSSIYGLSLRVGSEVRVNPARPQIDDLDTLPLPAFHLIPLKSYVSYEDFAKFQIEAGRGCPYVCNFCSTSLVWKRKYRVKSPERLVQEIKLVQQETDWKEFDFIHDNLAFRADYIASLCDAIKREGLDIRWSCTSRSDHISKETIQTMAHAGCASIFFGVESGNWERQKKIKKKVQLDKTVDTIRHCKDYGINPTCSFILGFSDETTDELNETLSYALKLKLEGAHVVQCPVLHLHTGTDLYNEFKNILEFSEIVNREHALSESLTPEREDVENQKDLYTFSLSSRSQIEDRRLYQIRSLFIFLFEGYPLTFSLLLNEKRLKPLEYFQNFILRLREKWIDGEFLKMPPMKRREVVFKVLSEFVSNDKILENIYRYENVWHQIRDTEAKMSKDSSKEGLLYLSPKASQRQFDYHLSDLIEYAKGTRAERPELKQTFILFKTEGDEGIAGETDETTFKLCKKISECASGFPLAWLENLSTHLGRKLNDIQRTLQLLKEEGIVVSH